MAIVEAITDAFKKVVKWFKDMLSGGGYHGGEAGEAWGDFQKNIDDLGKKTGLWHEGGEVEGKSTPSFAEYIKRVLGLKANEVLGILQKGEMIVPTNMRGFFDNMLKSISTQNIPNAIYAATSSAFKNFNPKMGGFGGGGLDISLHLNLASDVDKLFVKNARGQTKTARELRRLSGNNKKIAGLRVLA